MIASCKEGLHAFTKRAESEVQSVAKICLNPRASSSPAANITTVSSNITRLQSAMILCCDYHTRMIQNSIIGLIL